MIAATAITFDGNRAWWVPQLVHAGDGVFAVTGGPDNGLTDLPSLDRPCDTCDGTGANDPDEELDDVEIPVLLDPDTTDLFDCEDCDGTGQHTFHIEPECPVCDTSNGDRCYNPHTYRVSVVPGMVLPIHDHCPDEKPADHICCPTTVWTQHRSFDHDDWTERQITLPPDAKPGMFAVQLEVHQ